MKWFHRKKSNRRVTQQAQPPSRWPRLIAVVLAVLVVAAGGTALSLYLRSLELERFLALEISGELDRVSAQEIHDVLKPYVDAGFAGIDMRSAQHALEDLPWVADASVRRQWPGTLAVELREEQPVATWFGTALMNADGKIFVDGAAGYSGVLPDVGGPAGTQDDMIARLNEVQDAASIGGLELSRLMRSERRAERVWLKNGIEVRLGRRDIDARLQRFIAVAWPALRTRVEEIGYVDMRYTNGFAVGWKAGHASSASASLPERG